MVSQSKTRHWIFSSSSSGAKGIVCIDKPSKEGKYEKKYALFLLSPSCDVGVNDLV